MNRWNDLGWPQGGILLSQQLWLGKSMVEKIYGFAGWKDLKRLWKKMAVFLKLCGFLNELGLGHTGGSKRVGWHPI